MGVLTPKRAVLVFAAILFGTSAFGIHPSPRSLSRMAWDRAAGEAVLFGGLGNLDQATGVQHDSDETWTWNGGRWIERFPDTKPPGRSAHSMTYDSTRNRVVMYGGRQQPANRDGDTTAIGDTWFWQNGNWSPASSTQNPPARHYAGIAYDFDRDRVVLYGGSTITGREVKPIYDTWEFDGTQWAQTGTDNPKVAKPLLAYDAANKRVAMMGVAETTITPLMYFYDTATDTWTQHTTAKMPTCINEGHLFYDEVTRKLLFVGGICLTNTPNVEEVFEFDGTDWNKVTPFNVNVRGIGQAWTYDPVRTQIINFGGTTLSDPVVNSVTTVFNNNRWATTFSSGRPYPRSLSVFQPDFANNTVWLFGGLNEFSEVYYGDLWGYRNGQWFEVPQSDTSPGVDCQTPLGAVDSDRNVFVVTCAGRNVFEFNGATGQWTEPTITEFPPARNFANLVYDKKLKKIVLFGGYQLTNYRNDTWTWDGKDWKELDIDNDDRPPHRGLMAMWYDPLQQKTILYGGFGRPNVNSKVTRYDDMWSFDGTRWVKMTPQQTPGQRFGPQIAVNPESGKVLLFGGLRSEQVDEDSIRQYFDNDTWEWNGAGNAWTKIETAHKPDVRENGMLAWDPVANEMILFGGYTEGFYKSDTWVFNGQDWEPRIDIQKRRRAVR